MHPNGSGRFCDACAKTVIDFSLMSDEAVQSFFFTNNNQKICGHFSNTQLQRIRIQLPKNIFSIQLPLWKKFLLAFLIAYGASFLSVDIAMAGGPAYTQGAPIVTTERNNPPALNNKTGKKKKYRRKKKCLSRIELDPVISMISGMIRISDPDPDIAHAPYDKDHPLAGILLQTEKADTGISVKNNTGNSSPSKSPSPAYPITELLLPAAVLPKRTLFSKKKKSA